MYKRYGQRAHLIKCKLKKTVKLSRHWNDRFVEISDMEISDVETSDILNLKN